MNGPEHYREAERLVGEWQDELSELQRKGGALRSTPNALVEAQVHATLALAAATSLTVQGQFFELAQDADEWSNATQSPPSEGGRTG